MKTSLARGSSGPAVIRRSRRFTKCLAALAACAGLAPAGAWAAAQDEYWRTDGVTTSKWTDSVWGTSAAGPFTTAWTSGNNADFTANSTLTFATTTVGNVTVSDGFTTTVTAGGTLTLGGVRTFTIGTGSTLTWASQAQSTSAGNEGAGIIKSGAGTLNLGAIAANARYDGGFTLNAGTVIVSGASSFGTGALTLNGGSLQSSSTQAFTSTSITIGGDFALAGTGNANWDAATTIALGSTTRTITNSTASGSRQFRGLISGGTGAGLTFAGSGSAQIYIGNTGNTFSGPVAITGGEVVFNGDGALGAGTSVVIDGGRLTIGSMSTNGTVSGITAVTIASTRAIALGSTAGTSISINSSGSVTTYNGVMADKSGSTGIFVKQGGGTLALGGVNTYSGDTSINNGTLQITTGNNRLPTGTTVNIGQASSTNLGIFDLNGQGQQIAGLNSTAGTSASATLKNTVTSTGAATLTLGGSGTYAYGDGTPANSGVITGGIAVIKSGSGTQTFGDVNTYTGGTQVTGGSLLVNTAVSGTNSGTGAGAVSVTNAGSLLGGSGAVGGAVTIGNKAIIQGGTSTAPAGALTLAGTLTLSQGSIIQLFLGASGAHSSLATSGAAFDANQTFSFINVGAQVGTYNDIITGLAADPGSEANWTISTPGFMGSFSYDGTGDINLMVTAVPEPATVLGGLLMVGALGWSQRRRFGGWLAIAAQP